MIVIGIDVHKRTDTAVVTDQMGQQISTKTVARQVKTTSRYCNGRQEKTMIVSGRSRIAGT